MNGPYPHGERSAAPLSPPPPLTRLHDLNGRLADAGFAVVDAGVLATLTGTDAAALQQLQPQWDTLPPDAHLRDGGRYRRRRHGCYVVEHGAATPVPQRAHWQPVEYNALHGGTLRWFEPLLPQLTGQPAWAALLAGLGSVADALRGVQPWFVEAHPFRIDCTDGIGRPTPEGAHRDGVDLVVVVLVARHNVRGGETRVFDNHGPHGVRFTLGEEWSALLLDDERVVHESTPIQPVAAAQPAWRDTLVLTYRSGGFQGPATAPGG